MGALGSPKTGEPFSMNVFIVISLDSTGPIFGVGMISNSVEVELKPKSTPAIVIDAIIAPMASDGA